jgi:hypothetical protein
MRQDYPVPHVPLDGVSVSGYYAWRKRTPSPRALQEARLETEVLAAHHVHRDRRGMVVSCRPEGPVQRRNRWLCMSERMTKDLVMQALFRSVSNQRPKPA